MKNSSKVVQRYKELQKTGCTSLMSAMSESAFTAAIGLTGSNLTGNFLSRDVFNGINQRSEAFKQSFKGDINEVRDISELLEYPALREQAALLEILTHEMVHGLQKHAYRSVFTLVEALQTIELLELQLAVAHGSQNGSWQLGKSYLQCIDTFDGQMSEMMGGRLERAAKVALNAHGERQGGLGLLHLIEGQAHVAARISNMGLESIELGEVPTIYTAAWEHFSKSGGGNPSLFVSLTGAALRYGNIDDDTLSAFSDFLPHPVDIYLYLLNYVPELEVALAKMDKGARSPFASFTLKRPDLETHAKQFAAVDQDAIHDAVKDKRHLALDTSDSDFSFLKCNESLSNYDDEDEMIRIQSRLHRIIWDPLLPMVEAPTYSEMAGALAAIFLAMDMHIATIIEGTYTRLAEPLVDEFDRPREGKVSIAVGQLFIKTVPDYCNVGVFHKLILDQEFRIGKLVWFFMNQVPEEVEVRPFESMDSMLYIQYQGLRQIPEAVKRILEFYDWRSGEGDTPASGPYCCEKHGSLSLTANFISDLQECSEPDSTGQIVHHLLKRTVSSLFKEA